MAGESDVPATGVRELAAEVRGAGPDLVLLHPVGLDHTFMAPFLAQAPRRHRVVALDLRGHGDSPPATRDVTLDDYVVDIGLAMETHCRGRAIVLGLSFGGMLAQLVALTHPERVSGLVLCGCTGGFAPEVRPILRERGLAAERDGMPGVADATIERWFTASFRGSDAATRVRTRLLADDVTSWSTAWRAIAAFDALPHLSTLQVPTLVVAGERDAATPIAAATTLANAIPGARLTVLPDAPHMMQIESCAAFNAAVDPFLMSLARG